jgi:dephospho-CoA kinase
MLKIGITGGIGSGKSTVAKMFEVLGIPIYNADDAAKRLMNSDVALKQKLITQFGPKIYLSGVLNRPYLSEIVFNNPELLEQLNSIVHPATLADAAKWMQNQTAPYAIKEAALVFESGAHEHLDKIIGVFAPAELRIERVLARDNLTRDEIIMRMNKQINETIKMRLCDYVVINDEQQMLIPQVLKLHKTLLSLAL